MVVVLAGGTGGAKLAAGMQDLVGPGELTVIANTADDVEFHGVHVSPDPDLVTWWLGGLIDERGWGIAGDTFNVVEGLRAGGIDEWFNLGDRDLAMCMLRTGALRGGESLTAAHARVVTAAGVGAQVVPMSDEPVRTHVKFAGEWLPFQEYMIVRRAAGPIEDLEFRGIESARPSPAALEAIAAADAIVIGPSNPIISIRPILAVPGMREALAAARAPVVAVSPFLAGHSIKGPSDLFMEFAGLPLGTDGVVVEYDGVLDGLVADEPAGAPATVPVHVADTLMPDAAGRRRVAQITLQFAGTVRDGESSGAA